MDVTGRDLIAETVEDGVLTRYYMIRTDSTSFQTNLSEPGSEDEQAAREAIEARIAVAYVLPEVAGEEDDPDV